MHEPFAPPRALNAVGGRLERVRLVLQREHRRLEDRHEPDLERRLRLVARPVVPQAEGRVVDLLGAVGRRRWCRCSSRRRHPPPHAAATSASAISTASVRARVLDIALFPLWCGRWRALIYRIRRASMYIANAVPARRESHSRRRHTAACRGCARRSGCAGSATSRPRSCTAATTGSRAPRRAPRRRRRRAPGRPIVRSVRSAISCASSL